MRATRCFVVVLCAVVCIVATGLGAAAERPTERASPAPQCNANAVVWRTEQPPANPEAGDVWANPKDGMEMVYVAPGEFAMGISDAEIEAWLREHRSDRRVDFAHEQPQFRAQLPGYWIGRTEVTNAQYLKFVQASGHRAPAHWRDGKMPSGLDSYPVVYVSWDDARAYCEWAGGRLPSEMQWEKAARGSDGRMFPWGNEWDPSRCRDFAQVASSTEPATRSMVLRWLGTHDPVREGPAAVGSYPSGVSPYGCFDMAGNVDEWCADWYDRAAYARDAARDMTPPKAGKYRVLRGGSWYGLTARCLRSTYRTARRPMRMFTFTGFRCARGAAP